MLGRTTRGDSGQITHAYLPGAGDIPPIVGINGHYLLSFPDDRVVFGATREKEIFEHEVTVGGLMENIREVARIIPSIASAQVIETRVGFRPFTPDRIPHIRWAPTIDGLLLSLGISSQGMTMGAYTGAALADQALGIPGRDIPASFKPRIYRPSRISNGSRCPGIRLLPETNSTIDKQVLHVLCPPTRRHRDWRPSPGLIRLDYSYTGQRRWRRPRCG